MIMFFISLIIAVIAIIIGWDGSGISVFPAVIGLLAVWYLIERRRAARKFWNLDEPDLEKAGLDDEKEMEKAQWRIIIGPVLVVLSIVALIVEIVA